MTPEEEHTITENASAREKAQDFAKNVALSTIWRDRRSANELVELRYLLEDLQNLAVVTGRARGYSVKFHGMEKVPGYTLLDKRTISIGYDLLNDKPMPVPPDTVDDMCGIVLHELGHVRQGALWNKRLIRPQPRFASGRRTGRRVQRMQQAQQRLGVQDEKPHEETVPMPKLDDYTLRADTILRDVNIDAHIIREHPLRGAYILRSRRTVRATYETYIQGILDKPEKLDWKEVAALWSCISLFYDEALIDRFIVARIKSDLHAVNKYLQQLIDLAIRAANLDLDDIEDNETLRELILAAGAILRDYDDIQEALGQLPNMGMTGMSVPSSGAGTSGQQSQSSQQGQQDADDEGEDEANKNAAANTAEDGKDEEQQDEGSGSGAGEDEDDEAAGAPSDPFCNNPLEEDDEDDMSGSPSAGSASGEDAGDSGEPTGCSMVTGGDGQGGTTGKQGEIPEALAQALWDAMEKELEDVSKEAFGDADLGNTALLSKPKLDTAAVSRIPEHSVTQLQEAIRELEEVSVQRTIGLKRGNINAETLWKLPVGDDTIFERRLVEDAVDLQVGLCLDMSGSIGSSQWDVMMRTVTGFVKAIQGRPDIDLVITAYTTTYASNLGITSTYKGGGAPVAVFRIWEPGYEQPRIGDLRPSGATPTLPALRVTLDRMQKVCAPRRRKLLFSVTDGMPNVGGYEPEVKKWVAEQAQIGVQVVGIGVACDVSEQYPWHVNIDSFEQLPNALKSVFARVLVEASSE